MFKSNKGVTLTSLVIYVIVLIIVIGLMSNFLGHFYKNINEISIEESNDEQITRLLAYLTKDVNTEGLNFIKTGTTTEEETSSEINYIILRFKDGKEHQYLFIEKNESINFIKKSVEDEAADEKIALCRNVSLGNFTYEKENQILIIDININGEKYTKSLKVDF